MIQWLLQAVYDLRDVGGFKGLGRDQLLLINGSGSGGRVQDFSGLGTGIDNEYFAR